MNVQASLWEHTAARHILACFTNDISANISLLHEPRQLLNAEEHMPYLLWRWMHLSLPHMGGATPSKFLEEISRAERWPETGQFFPTASLTFSRTAAMSDAHVNIATAMDYIAFDEQPLIRDVQNTCDGKPLHYPWGPPYHHTAIRLANALSPLIKRGLSNNELAYAVCRSAVSSSLSAWYEARTYLQHGFSFDAWQNFWLIRLQEMHAENGLSTDTLLDTYTSAMRAVIPGFSFTTEELVAYKPERKNGPSRQFMEQYDFWGSFSSFFLIPLSLYLPLIEPTYTDQKNFIDDMLLFFRTPLADPFHAIGPCTHLSLTRFGNMFLPSIEAGFYQEFAV